MEKTFPESPVTKSPDPPTAAGSSDFVGEDGASAMAHVKQAMLNRIAKSDAFFKQQQRDDPDLTPDEKFKIAEDLLDNKISAFLTRYNAFLETEDLEYFNDKSGDYIISFQLKEIRQRLNKFTNKTIIRNRRYEAMNELMKDGEYFGDEELKRRDPLMYEQMIGQYLDEEEVRALVEKSTDKFSSMLLQNIEMTQNNILYQKQVESEAKQMEESEKESEDEEDESEESELESEEEDSAVEKLPPGEKQMLREEFIRIMQLRFLNGEDEDFDYSQVDGNAEYDSLDIREHDEQEKYFDAEEPEMIDMEIEQPTSNHSSSKPNSEM